MLCDPLVGLWRPGGSYSARRLVPGYFRAHGRLARALQLVAESEAMWSLAMKVRARNKPISSTYSRAKCRQTRISALKLAEWLRAGRGEATTVQWASRLLARSSREGRRRRRVPHAGRESPWGPVWARGLGSTHVSKIG